MTLAIPAGAVPEGTEITATPLRSLAGLAVRGRAGRAEAGAVRARAAAARDADAAEAAGPGTVVGFGFDGDGEELHLVPATVSGDTVQLKVWHFSGAGTLTASAERAAAPCSATRRPGRTGGPSSGSPPPCIDAAANGSDPAQAIFDALADWRRSVSNGLQVARDTGPARLLRARLRRMAGLAGVRAGVPRQRHRRPGHRPSTSSSASTRRSQPQAAYDVGLNVLTRCVGPGVPRSALRDVIRLATAVVLAALPIDQADDPSERQLPSGDGLARACLDVELLAFEHAPSLRPQPRQPLHRTSRASSSGTDLPAARSRSATGSATPPPARRPRSPAAPAPPAATRTPSPRPRSAPATTS